MATTYLSATQSTPTDNIKWTFSTWIKRADVSSGTIEYLFTAKDGDTNYFNVRFSDIDQLDVQNWVSGSGGGRLITTRKFRDPAAWYHMVVVFDSANVTSGDRIRMYVNGVEETAFATDTAPSASQACIMNADTMAIRIGSRDGEADATIFNGVLAHTHFCDGQAYAASDFGETDSTSGIWVAKTSPSVTYGNNGFFLKYQDTSAFGDDSSGNTNDFTVSGTMTQTKDTPDNNFCVMNPLYNYYQAATFSNGNNTVATANNAPSLGTIGVESGKWYWEAKAVSASSGGSDFLVGVSSSQIQSADKELGNYVNDYGYAASGNLRNDDGNTAYGNTYAAGDIIGVALDLTNMNLYFSKNGTWQNSGDPTSGATGTGAIDITQGAYITNPLNAWFPAVCGDSNGQNYTWSTNFGNGYFGTTAVSSAESDDAGIGSFEYDVPAGYYALCTTNLGDQS